MATLADILTIKYPGSGDGRIAWKMDAADDYAKLTWLGTDPKPSEATLRALAAEVDAGAYQRRLDEVQAAFTVGDGLMLMRAVDACINCLQDMKKALNGSVSLTAAKWQKLKDSEDAIATAKQAAKAALDARIARGG